MMGGRLCVAHRIKGNDEIRDSPLVRDSPNNQAGVLGKDSLWIRVLSKRSVIYYIETIDIS